MIKEGYSYADLSGAGCALGYTAKLSAPDAARRFAGRAVLLALWWLCAVPGGSAAAEGIEVAGTTRFIDRTYGVSLILPGEWVSVPVRLLNVPMGQMISANLAKQVQAFAAFQRGPDRSAINRPFCSLQAIQSGWRGGPTAKQFDLVIQAMSAGTRVFMEKIERMSLYSPAEIKEFRTVLAGTAPGPLHADPSSLRFWRVVDGTDSADQPVRSLTTGVFLTNGYMITLNCYADRARFKQVVGEFAVIDHSMSDLSP